MVLEFDLDPVDAAIVQLLEGAAPGTLDVHVGAVGDSDANAKTISAPLPYVLYSSALPYQPNRRIGGWRPDTTDFTVTAVHESLEGAKAVAAAVRGLLQGHQVVVDGRAQRIRLRDPDRPVDVANDQVWSRPGGAPLFFAVDRYFVRP